MACKTRYAPQRTHHATWLPMFSSMYSWYTRSEYSIRPAISSISGGFDGLLARARPITTSHCNTIIMPRYHAITTQRASPPQCHNAVWTLQEIPPWRRLNTVCHYSDVGLRPRQRRVTKTTAVTRTIHRRVEDRDDDHDHNGAVRTATTATQSDEDVSGYNNHTPTTSQRPRQRKACNKACNVVGPS
ncbi:hypothetical protein EDB83DRAFT_2322788 [Lactarius deliciosus]|nr:hypothetical protein EDB83DRAFT_2322788 [Lactarius deliciosus]